MTASWYFFDELIKSTIIYTCFGRLSSFLCRVQHECYYLLGHYWSLNLLLHQYRFIDFVHKCLLQKMRHKPIRRRNKKGVFDRTWSQKYILMFHIRPSTIIYNHQMHFELQGNCIRWFRKWWSFRLQRLRNWQHKWLKYNTFYYLRECERKKNHINYDLWDSIVIHVFDDKQKIFRLRQVWRIRYKSVSMIFFFLQHLRNAQKHIFSYNLHLGENLQWIFRRILDTIYLNLFLWHRK